MKKLLFILIFLNCIVFAYDKAVFVGNPYKSVYKSGEAIYARNIWDMQLFEGKIYLGAGNSSNYGPAQNAGRVDVVSLDPISGKFDYEYKVAEEQVDIFKVYNDSLYIPGHDATQKWDFGNIYKKSANKWFKYRTLPKALHVYDLVVKDNKIFTAVGLYGGGAVFVSDMTAQKWQQIPQGKGRVYSFIEVKDELFAVKKFKKKHPRDLNITQWLNDRDTLSARFDLNIIKMFPDTKLHNGSIKIIKSLKAKDETFYIGAYKHNDHQNLPFGVYKMWIKNDEVNVQRVELPNGFIPRDIIQRDAKIFILANKEISEGIENTLFLYGDNELKSYLSFPYDSFARSFEKYKDCFYFGIGSEIKNPLKWSISELSKETGDIVKVCK